MRKFLFAGCADEFVLSVLTAILLVFSFSQPSGDASQQPSQQALPQPQAMTQQPATNVNPAVANWAFAQAAVALGPLLSQLTASNIQQVQQQLQAEQQKAQLQSQIQEHQNRLLQQQLLQLQEQQKQPAPAPSCHAVTSNEKFAVGLKQAYESILQKQQQHKQQCSVQRPPDCNKRQVSPTVSRASSASCHLSSQQPQLNKQAVASIPAAPARAKPRTAKDKAGGSDLLGFLSTLRQSYENALRTKQTVSGNGGGGSAEVVSNVVSSRNSDSASDDASPHHPMVTDSASSQQLESSADDSEEWTSKKTDPSSSSDCGDSDKEVNDRKQRARKEQSKGPPRKRHKCMNIQTARPNNSF